MATNDLQSLCWQFPYVDGEVVTAVLESSAAEDLDGPLQVLLELQTAAIASLADDEAHTVPLTLQPQLGTNRDLSQEPLELGSICRAGASILRIEIDDRLMASEPSTEIACASKLNLVTPLGDSRPLAWHEPPFFLRLPWFGWYRLILDAPGGHVEARFHLSSEVGDFAESLEEFFDALAWAWDGNWTEELSDATLNLIVGVDEFMERLRAMFAPLVPMLGGSVKSLLDQPRKQLETVLAKVMDQHDGTAIGQTHTALRDLLQQVGAISMFGPMLGGGIGYDKEGEFSKIALDFEMARLAASSDAARDRIRTTLYRLTSIVDTYVLYIQTQEARGVPCGTVSSFPKEWHSPGGIRSSLEAMAAHEYCVGDLQSVMKLQGGGGGFLADCMGKFASAAGGAQLGQALKIEHMPFLDTDGLMLRTDIASTIAYWAETLDSGAIVIGAPMAPMRLSAATQSLEWSVQLLQRLLNLGFGYVVQGDAEEKDDRGDGMLLGMMDRVRCTLPLRAYGSFLEDRRRRARLQDVARVIRSRKKNGKTFSLRLNSDFHLALRNLREHHEDSWVGSILADVWAKMFERNELLIFELWILENGVEKMIAADFGHPHSNCGIYVATRFYDRNYKTDMPGFILAFAEAEILAKGGFDFWDLGGTNSSPMMAYKPQVALELRKTVFLDLLHAAKRRSAEPVTVPACGNIISEIEESSLWGFSSLRIDSETAGAKVKPSKPPRPPRKGRALQKAKAANDLASEIGNASHKSEASANGSGDGSTASRPVRETMQARFKTIHAELLAQGLDPTTAAAEALKRVSDSAGYH